MLNTISTLKTKASQQTDRCSLLLKTVFLFAVMLVLGNQSFAQLTTNTFTGASACPTNGNTFSAVSNATVAAFTRNTITCNATANVFNSTTLVTSATRNDNSYIEFSITANAGFVLNLTSLSFLRQASASAPNISSEGVARSGPESGPPDAATPKISTGT